MKRLGFVVALIMVLPACRKGPAPEASHPTPPDHAAQVEQWRAKH